MGAELSTIRSYNWDGRGKIDVHTVGNKVLVVVPWFAYDYQISGGSVPPGVAFAQALHDQYKDQEDVLVVAYSSKIQSGIEVIKRRDTTVALASCPEFVGPYRMHSESSSYSFGILIIDRNGKIALQKSDYASTEGSAKGEAKGYFKAINYLRAEKRIAGVPEIVPPEAPEVEERSLRMVAKSINNGISVVTTKKSSPSLRNPVTPKQRASRQRSIPGRTNRKRSSPALRVRRHLRSCRVQ